MNEGGCQKEDGQGPWCGRDFDLPQEILNLPHLPRGFVYLISQ